MRYGVPRHARYDNQLTPSGAMLTSPSAFDAKSLRMTANEDLPIQRCARWIQLCAIEALSTQCRTRNHLANYRGWLPNVSASTSRERQSL